MADTRTPSDRYNAELAGRLARARQQAAERHPEGLYEEAVESLQHPDAAVRQEAVVFLGRHLRKRDDAQVLLKMVAADPSPEVRKLSAQCLGGIFRSTRNRQVNEVLAEAAKKPDEDAAVRAMAYAAIRRINGY